jgi:hypothetical protein
MYEDAKMSKKHIYTAYSDFKGVFGGMDHRIFFKPMRDLGFPEYTSTHVNNFTKYPAPTT